MEGIQVNENNTNKIDENKVDQENTSTIPKEKRVIEHSVGILEDEKTYGVDIGLDWKEGREVSFILSKDKFLDNFIDRFGKGLIEKMQNVHNDDKTNSEFDEILATLPIYPCPIFKSKLILALDYILGDMQIKETSPLDSTFRIFKKLMRAEKLIFLHSTKKKLEEKQKIQKMRTTVFNNIVAKLFLSYTKLAFLPIGQNSTITNYLMENFYNNLNVIRIWEFTILDYLDVPKKFQGNFITSEASIIPNDISLFRDTAASVLHDTKLLFDKLLTSQYVETKLDWESLCPKDMDPPEWIYKKSSAFVLFHLKYAKELKKDDKFSCGSQKCKKVEYTKREFKQCSKCHWTRYCSRECQVGDWNDKHKLNCCKERSTDYFSKGRLVIGPDV